MTEAKDAAPARRPRRRQPPAAPAPPPADGPPDLADLQDTPAAQNGKAASRRPRRDRAAAPSDVPATTAPSAAAPDAKPSRRGRRGQAPADEATVAQADAADPGSTTLVLPDLVDESDAPPQEAIESVSDTAVEAARAVGEAVKAPGAESNASALTTPAEQPAEPEGTGEESTAPPARRRGRPPGSRTAAAAPEATLEAPPAPTPEPAPSAEDTPRRQRQRRRAETLKALAVAEGEAGHTPIPVAAAQEDAIPDQALTVDAALPNDPLFRQLGQLWHGLHPQARRAIMMYAAVLSVEGA